MSTIRNQEFRLEKNDGNAVVFPAIFTAKTAQDSKVLWKHLVFVFATVAKDITSLSPHGKYLRIWRRYEWPAPTLVVNN